MIYLAIINTNTNICENVTIDDRPIEDIVLSEPYIAIDLLTTMAIKGYRDSETGEWVEHPPALGIGGIGMQWDGDKLIQIPNPV